MMEKKMEHTPGPWIVDFEGSKGHIKAIVGEQSPTICKYGVDYRGERFSAESIDEHTAANAKLIAAAPDLLAACKLLMEHINEGLVSVYEEKADNGQPGVSACELIEAAIKRANAN